MAILYVLNDLLFSNVIDFLILPGLDGLIVVYLRSECVIEGMVFLILFCESFLLIPQVVVGNSLEGVPMNL